ncbi:MAG TPA: hypothetical protein VL461_12670 [Dictyobacter sp.]|jgi:hypothetical protein|nr:hypothetical protein [Dictyobacter sp.]
MNLQHFRAGRRMGYLGVFALIIPLLLSSCGVTISSEKLLADFRLLSQSISTTHHTPSMSFTISGHVSLSNPLPPDIQQGTYTLAGNGTEALAQKGQEQLQLTTSNANAHQSISEIYEQHHLYVQLQSQQWLAVLLSNQMTSNIRTIKTSKIAQALQSSNPNIATLLPLAQHMQIQDHGNVALNGQQLHYLTISFDTYAMKQFLNNATNITYGQWQYSLATAKGSVGLWIASSNLINQVNITAQMSVNAVNTQTHVQERSTIKTNTTVKLSKSVQPVSESITIPQNARVVNLGTGETLPGLSPQASPTTISSTPTQTACSGSTCQSGAQNLPMSLFNTLPTVQHTWYSAPNNDPPGYDSYAHAKGDGTYASPITFAIADNSSTFHQGEEIYIPELEKYFYAEDTCSACAQDGHIDLWTGDISSQCADNITVPPTIYSSSTDPEPVHYLAVTASDTADQNYTVNTQAFTCGGGGN